MDLEVVGEDEVFQFQMNVVLRQPRTAIVIIQALFKIKENRGRLELDIFLWLSNQTQLTQAITHVVNHLVFLKFTTFMFQSYTNE